MTRKVNVGIVQMSCSAVPKENLEKVKGKGGVFNYISASLAKARHSTSATSVRGLEKLRVI